MLLCVCITGEPLKRKGKWTESKTRRTYIVDQHTATEWKDRAPCKCCEFAWCVLLPAAALLMTERERETESVGAVFEQMGVSHFCVVLLPSGYSSLFICGSCKFRLQCQVPHSYLCVKASLAGLAWYSQVFQVNQLTILSHLTFMFNR